MKKLTVLTLTLALIAAMAVTTATAQQDDVDGAIIIAGGGETEPVEPTAPVVAEGYQLSTRYPSQEEWIYDIAFLDNTTMIYSDAEGISKEDVYSGSGWRVSPQRGQATQLAAPSNDATFFVSSLDNFQGGRNIHIRTSNGTDMTNQFGQPPWHTGYVRDLAFKPESFILASASDDQTVRIWDVENPNDIHRLTLQGHTDWVRSVAWHPNRNLLASASDDGTVRIWDTLNGIPIATLRHPDEDRYIFAVAWHPDGNLLVSGALSGSIKLWDVEDRNNINFLHSLQEHPGAVQSLAFSPDGQTLVSADDNKTIFWNANAIGDPRVDHVESSFNDGGRHLAFSPNGQFLACVQNHWESHEEPNDVFIGSQILLYEFMSNTGEGTTDGGDDPDGGDETEPTAPVADGGDAAGTETAGSNNESLIATLGFIIADVNGNGVISQADLVIVAQNYGLSRDQEGDPPMDTAADINGDGKVDVTDILIMIVAIDAAEAIGAPALTPADIKTGSLQAADVRQWIRDAKQANADPASIAALERLLTSLNRRDLPVPKKTVLLANYPNPFNPETWIPYQLAEAAEVQVSIYSADGKLVRALDLGQVPAGIYQNRSRAAYWNGQNAQGEPVASGVYFYTLTAGEFSATRKMVIRK